MKREDFNAYVQQALANPDLAAMRPVVEKELLHYEIFSALDEDGLLAHLVFQGGTSLRLCRGSDRFSEDLDFAGGKDFSVDSMARIKECITKRIGDRFGLNVTVKEPKPANPAANIDVAKWMVSIETSPGEPDVPRQKIKLEIANIPAYTREAVPLRLNYPMLEGMHQVLVVTETIDEILADKVVALPTSIAKLENRALVPTPSRIRHRDIWDLAWLIGQGARLNSDLVSKKIADYHIREFDRLLSNAIEAIPSIASSNDFNAQMRRFIRKSAHDNAFSKPGFDTYLETTLVRLFSEVQKALHTQTPEASPASPHIERRRRPDSSFGM